MTQARKDMIVNLHNQYRNEFAGGVDNFKPAGALTVVQWDNELAKMAEYNVKRCDTRLDHCRNTPSYYYVGQSTITFEWDPKVDKDFTVDNVISHQIKNWYNFKRFATQKDLEYYPVNAPP